MLRFFTSSYCPLACRATCLGQLIGRATRWDRGGCRRFLSKQEDVSCGRIPSVLALQTSSDNGLPGEGFSFLLLNAMLRQAVMAWAWWYAVWMRSPCQPLRSGYNTANPASKDCGCFKSSWCANLISCHRYYFMTTLSRTFLLLELMFSCTSANQF